MRDKTIAILESRLGQELAELVGKHGGRPFHAPALAEIPDVDHAYIATLIRELEARPAMAAIFQTGVGTRALFRATDALGLTEKLLALLAKTVVVVRGPKPTAALRSRNVRIDVSADEPYTTAEVLAALAEMPLTGARVVVQRYGGPNPELDQALKARGAEVVEVPLYRWSLPENTQPLIELMDALDRSEIDAVTVTNAAQVYNLFALAKQLGRADTLKANLNKVLVASIGPVASDALKKFNVTVGLEPRPPKLGPLVAALDETLSR
ncbi:MAG: uroporphyrinogen-III synthase [Betaproteobacteria bacterium]|nr:uroporphyrinogen-III synthase [Betaproteobacteria bacterium]